MLIDTSQDQLSIQLQKRFKLNLSLNYRVRQLLHSFHTVPIAKNDTKLNLLIFWQNEVLTRNNFLTSAWWALDKTG